MHIMYEKYDQIKITDLEVFANHGVFPEENTLGQKFLVSVALYTSTRRAGLSDDLTASIHYGEVSSFIDRYLREHTFKLLERTAEALAEELLLHTKGLEKIRLEIKKPWAPVKLPLKTVSVEIERGWHTAYIALGSNMGDRESYLNDAVTALDAVRGCSVKKVSRFIETPPYGVTDQDDFLNGCLELRTLLPPDELLEELHRIDLLRRPDLRKRQSLYPACGNAQAEIRTGAALRDRALQKTPGVWENSVGIESGFVCEDGRRKTSVNRRLF